MCLSSFRCDPRVCGPIGAALTNRQMYQYAGMPRYRTTKPVAKGDELILDYGTEYFETRKGEI